MTDCFVGFDTSNYTTSAAICSREGEILVNCKRPLPVGEGACGLRQSDAVFSHIKNLPDLTEELRTHLAGKRVLAVGCSATPRSVTGSYMPCFLSGVAAAHAFAAAADAPLLRVSHQDGHIMAAAYSSGASELLLRAPFAAFHVSGGTTEVLRVTPSASDFSVEEVGGTADLNAGQLIDRIGVRMGLSFPCGREMEALAAENTRKLPMPRISVRDGICNLSGAENLATRLWEETRDPSYVSAYVFSLLAATLSRMTEQLDARYPGLPVVYAGGVMSNRYLQSVLGRRPDTYFAEPAFSSDNAAGVALLTRRHYFA